MIQQRSSAIEPIVRATLATAAILLATPPPAHAWEKHASLMPSILAHLPVDVAAKLDQPLPAPCPEDDQRIYDRLAIELKLNPKAQVQATDFTACAKGRPVTGRTILAAFVDEPDHGMDRDIPGPREDFDPQDVAKWMGGTSGPTSAGFRHMHFGGWQLWHPIKTFQIPPGAIGYAPDRAALMARKARELLQKGGVEAAWGYRVLAWSIHYLQDLAQPFHAVQIPHLNMVPWYAILRWPPGEGFADLVSETTRTIANYHWAYEQYTLYRLTTLIGGAGPAQEKRSAYADCLEKPDASPVDAGRPGETRAVLLEDPRLAELGHDPLLLARRVARASVWIGAELGAANMRFFGVGLKNRSVDIPAGKGEPVYAELAVDPSLVEARAELARVTCRALGDASMATRMVIEHVASATAAPSSSR
jgi:hypothetical protein